MNGYTICKAVDKGFYVSAPHQSRHADNPIVCAGTLQECLEYVQSKYEEQSD